MTSASADRSLTPAQERVYQRLVEHNRRTGSLPDLSGLARTLGIHYVSLKQHLEALQTKGYLLFESRGRGRSPRLELPAEATGIPLTSLEAYGNAAEIQRQQHPECGLGWTTLAGIAARETKHGRHDGASVAANGDVRPKIRGPQLDGTNGNLEIRDTDKGKLDGDTVYDRAMGPFQFIPETWQRYGVDANGDGKADPDNIDDAALSAARYLCVYADGDMTTPEGWEQGVHAYNNHTAYVLDVRNYANAYSVNIRY